MSRTSGRRGLMISGLLLLVVMVLLDLTRADSLLVRAWHTVQPGSQTPLEGVIEDFRRTRGESIRR